MEYDVWSSERPRRHVEEEVGPGFDPGASMWVQML
ncbi:hypothetical protein A2U01_0116336 [Trifolium medium]|uniref:Uncharacterized protein n=1 Tax=Trifolium medium TaxID=97028 RepID=A0A392W335_9FABA|nr:hypothetical protein [Trifolium medium]